MENKSLIQQILEMVVTAFSNNKPAVEKAVIQAVSKDVAQPVAPVQVEIKQEINWADPACKVSKYFNVKELLYLPTWKRMANEADGLNETIKENLVDLAKSMDTVRDHFGKPIRIHVTYRPLEYNKAIGGALHSAHSDGQAMDFDIVGLTCDDVRKAINDANLLETWQMRMENIDGNWVHLDRRQPTAGGQRFFKP